MKSGTTICRTLTLATALVIGAGALAPSARADSDAYNLFIQRSPVEAGDVTPTTGAHSFSANSSVTLTAKPQPGYRFAYWIGDVSDPAAERTTVVVNQPKIVIAVFHLETAKRADEQIRATGAAGGFDMIAPTATDLSAPGWSPGGGAAKGDTRIIPTVVPVVVPEPATIALLAFGIVAVRRRSRRTRL